MTKHLKKILVRFNGLQLLDREFIPWLAFVWLAVVLNLATGRTILV
ncbi:MAG: hypothetical protein NTY89_05215 [Nostocales cyanobacterium LacPavin_0920_SED1_MAG_38_18]|uniref:Uncharacterized protein n=1 Tax=Aphanizomenon flos-aquae FACHB-1040 TaxID=2692887 RepID=A0ABR8BS93_APHFL|nr:hypothetical protein [Aphanizomenon flos-aquae]MBD2277809.1 hypothetical protein [Aphanizomenon flos-aquae FACHB-1040]MBO1069776.1 hypothetical protein [Dolichospermum sp. DEX189]MCX5981197.1 hypothetical protein [Nostocales cyanobacterium LacPavin_0920_SED1_MAG_38_18]